jgi:hypothetical protein
MTPTPSAVTEVRTRHDVVVSIRALDPNADQGVIRQANLIPTPEEAFSLRQLLIAAANPRMSSSVVRAFVSHEEARRSRGRKRSVGAGEHGV